MADYPVLISYDIEKKNDAVHSFVKTCMEEKGFYDAFIFTNTAGVKRIIDLPNTTLWKPLTDAKKAFDDIKDCLDRYEKKTKTKHELEKFISTNFTGGWWSLAKDATLEQIKKYPERN